LAKFHTQKNAGWYYWILVFQFFFSWKNLAHFRAQNIKRNNLTQIPYFLFINFLIGTTRSQKTDRGKSDTLELSIK
jgi:hypothetical protein